MSVKQVECPRILAVFCEPKLSHTDSQKDRIELHLIQQSIFKAGKDYKLWLLKNAQNFNVFLSRALPPLASYLQNEL
jgi:hypothetical protein